MSRVIDILGGDISVFKDRNELYGSGYKKHGDVMRSLFPAGLTLKTSEDFGRFALLDLVVVKLVRYSARFLFPGDGIDSLRDLRTYACMLQEMDEESKDESM